MKLFKNPKLQFIPLVLTTHHQPIYRRLKRTTIYLLIYSVVVILAETFFAKWFDEFQFEKVGQFHLIFSFVLAILVSFRIGTAYSRWWDARSNWGCLVNDSRNFAIKFNNYIGFNNNQHLLDCLTQFPELLKHHLRKENGKCQKIITSLGLNLPEHSNLPSAVVNEIYHIINRYRNDGKLSFEQFLTLDKHLTSMVDVLGSCEKIANTPVPSLFKIFARQALFFYMIIFPFGWVDKFGFLIIPMIIVIVDVLLGLELVSEDLETPFENHHVGYSHSDLDLNLDSIAHTIASNVTAIAKQHNPIA